MVRKKLPAELGLRVIDALGDDHDLKERPTRYRTRTSSPHQALSSCALVCKEWLRTSRIHLFRVIHVHDRKGLDSLMRVQKHSAKEEEEEAGKGSKESAGEGEKSRLEVGR